MELDSKAGLSYTTSLLMLKILGKATGPSISTSYDAAFHNVDVCVDWFGDA